VIEMAVSLNGMTMKFHVLDKTMKDDGTTVIDFQPQLVNPITNAVFQLSLLKLSIPTANDIFAVGSNYDSSFNTTV
jgi:hypothetical protein